MYYPSQHNLNMCRSLLMGEVFIARRSAKSQNFVAVLANL